MTAVRLPLIRASISIPIRIYTARPNLAFPGSRPHERLVPHLILQASQASGRLESRIRRRQEVPKFEIHMCSWLLI
jgi:hypothetical protein